MVQNLGVLFECPINQGSCTPLVDADATGNDRKLYDVDGELFTYACMHACDILFLQTMITLKSKRINFLVYPWKVTATSSW